MSDFESDDDALSRTSSIYSWNGYYGDIGDIETTLAETALDETALAGPMLRDMEDDPAGPLLLGNRVMLGNRANVEDSIATPLYSDGDVLQPNANWMESERLQEEDGSQTKMWYSRRKDYLKKYAHAKRLGMPLRQRDMRQLLQYSPEAMDKSLDRKLRQALKTEDLDLARHYYTKDANLVDDMRRGMNEVARHKLKNSQGKKYLDDDVIDKILRYVDPRMLMPGVPHNLNEYHDVPYPTAPAFQVAALGSRNRWLSRQTLHPMYREPYHPFPPPDWPIDEESLHKLQQIEDQDCKSADNIAMRAVYQSPELLALINSYV
jgi:hypothetical protein